MMLTHLPEQETFLLAPVDLCSKQLVSSGPILRMCLFWVINFLHGENWLEPGKTTEAGFHGSRTEYLPWELKTMKHLGAPVSSKKLNTF